MPHDVRTDVLCLRATVADDRDLAWRLWPLGRWVARGEGLLARPDERSPADWSDLAPGFELSAAVLRHLQADPVLPPALLPTGWPGRPPCAPPTTGGTPATGRCWRPGTAPVDAPTAPWTAPGGRPTRWPPACP
ncbi:MAG: hypothetical protein ACRDYZ_15305, partial [Acidimicrobiales bacterium]